VKTLKRITDELREQVEEATNPKDPSQLVNYTASLRDGIDAIASLLPDDPTLLALALHGQIKFLKPQICQELVDRGGIVKEDWILVKPTILVRPTAHAAVKAAENAQLEEVLAVAVVANFILAKNLGKQNGKKQEEEEFNYVD